MQKTFYLFTDAAVSPQNNLGVTAFLCLNQLDLEKLTKESCINLAHNIHFQEIVSRKSSYLEILSAMHGLNTLRKKVDYKADVEIFTDCQSLCDLLGVRKQKLLEQNFISRSGKILANAHLYQELFSIANHFNITAHKLKGHSPQSYRINIYEQIFAMLDREVRKKLRTSLKYCHSQQNLT